MYSERRRRHEKASIMATNKPKWSRLALSEDAKTPYESIRSRVKGSLLLEGLLSFAARRLKPARAICTGGEERKDASWLAIFRLKATPER